MDVSNDVILQGVIGVTGIGLEDSEGIAVVLVQAVLGTKPHKAFPVLANAPHRVLGKAVLGFQVFEAEAVGLAVACPTNTQEEK